MTRGEGVIVGAICLIALVLRVIGLQYGLPAVYNPDEVAIMARALSFANGTLNPHNFLYPTFYFYVLFVWVAIYLAFVWISGRATSLAALQRSYFTDATGIYTAGRALGVATGTATVAFLYKLAATLTDRRSALASAVFLAVAPLHVRDSHYVKHDVAATLTIVLAYLAMTRVWPSPRPDGPRLRDTLIAGAACGMAFSTHYYCVFLAVPLALVIVQGWKLHGVAACARQLLWGAAASLVVFLALSPFLIVEPLTAWRDIAANRQIVVDRAVTAGAFAPAQRYVAMLWRDAAGQPIALLAVAGVGAMLVSSPARAALLLAFPVPFLLFIVNTAPASRYLNPVLPFLAMFAAWGLSTLVSWMGNRRAVFWIGLVIAAAPAFDASVRTDMFFRIDDTRTLARRYIEGNIPAGSSILIQPYSAALTPSREGLVEALTRNLGSPQKASRKFQLQLSLDPYPQPSYRLLYLGRGGLDPEKIYFDPAELGGSAGLEPLNRAGVAYAVITRYNRPDPVTLPFLTALAREGRRIAAFSPYRPGTSEAEQTRIDPFLHNTDARIDDALERPGPALEIWQLNDHRRER
jgi:4-amino-4-deoxy-L-arabinose transferase-like glycosyltransferase